MEYRKFLEIGPSMEGKIGPEWDTLNLTARGFTPEFLADISKPPLPIPDNTYELIYASHVLEHLPWKQVVPVLADWERILRPGCYLEVWVPDFAQVIQARPKIGMKEVNEIIFSHGAVVASRHHCTFDYGFLKDCFEDAGFFDIGGLTAPRGKAHEYNLGMKGKKLGSDPTE